MQLGYAALVIDDGSVDRTAEKAEREGAIVLRLPVNLGVGGALRCGFRYAVTHGYSTVVQCDADGQHDPAEIAVLLDAMRTHDAELVIGSRFERDEQDYDVGATRRFVMHRLAHLATAADRRDRSPTRPPASARSAAALLGSFAASYPAEYLGDTIEALAQAGPGRLPGHPGRRPHAAARRRASRPRRR